jgi:hypothetical protein
MTDIETANVRLEAMRIAIEWSKYIDDVTLRSTIEMAAEVSDFLISGTFTASANEGTSK